MNCKSLIAAILLLGCAISQAAEEKAAQSIAYKLTGLYCQVREDDLRQVLNDVPGMKLKSVSFSKAEATFEYDPDALPLEQLNKLLKPAGFEIKRLATGDDPKLALIVIPVVGLDCKGCCLAAYDAIYKIEGVEQATASFKAGRVTALIDPAKTNRAALEEALKKQKVMLLSGEE